MKKIYLIVSLAFLFTNLSYAEKVECHLLSPMQKAIYKAYCQAQEKKTEQPENAAYSGSWTKIFVFLIRSFLEGEKKVVH